MVSILESRGLRDLINFQGKKLFNFASNDYLGFSKDKKIINESIKWTQKYGSSLSSSRLVTGNLDKINLIENLISKKIGHEKSTIVGNGFLLNSTLIPALTGNSLGKRNKFLIFSTNIIMPVLIMDVLSHVRNVWVQSFRFEPLRTIKKIKTNEKNDYFRNTLLDGDIVDLDGLRLLSEKYNTILYLDEAHAFGIFGKYGFGLASEKKK